MPRESQLGKKKKKKNSHVFDSQLCFALLSLLSVGFALLCCLFLNFLFSSSRQKRAKSGNINRNMDPYEIEFIGENRIISVIPNFTYEKIYLICGEFGPFRAGLPMNVPLWLAMMLKQKQKCRIVPPDWMDMEVLETIKEEEKRSKFFTKMPNEHYMIEAKLILGAANEDVPNASEIKTVIKDIWDIRMSKLRTSMDALMKTGRGYGRLDHLTMMEINSVKPLLPAAMDNLLRIKLKAKKTTPSVNLNNSTFSQSGSSSQNL